MLGTSTRTVDVNRHDKGMRLHLSVSSPGSSVVLTPALISIIVSTASPIVTSTAIGSAAPDIAFTYTFEISGAASVFGSFAVNGAILKNGKSVMP